MRGDDFGPMGPRNGRGWGDRDDLGWGMHDGIGWAGWLVMVFFILLLLALVVGVVLLVVRSARQVPPTGPGGHGRTAAEHLLDERFARGEIEEEEYLHRRMVLRGESPPGG